MASQQSKSNAEEANDFEIVASTAPSTTSTTSSSSSTATTTSTTSITASSTTSSSTTTTSPTSSNLADLGLVGWMASNGGGLLSSLKSRTQSSVASVMTTLDPQMKAYLSTGGDVHLIVIASNVSVFESVRDAFQSVFGLATLRAINPLPNVSAAKQPVGFAAGRQAALERIQNLRTKSLVKADEPVIAVENFILESSDDNWVLIPLLLISDNVNQLVMQGQATPIDNELVSKAQLATPEDHPRRWSGLDQVVVADDDLKWHQDVCGVERVEIIYLAAKALAGLYKKRLEEQKRQEQAN